MAKDTAPRLTFAEVQAFPTLAEKAPNKNSESIGDTQQTIAWISPRRTEGPMSQLVRNSRSYLVHQLLRQMKAPLGKCFEVCRSGF